VRDCPGLRDQATSTLKFNLSGTEDGPTVHTLISPSAPSRLGKKRHNSGPHSRPGPRPGRGGHGLVTTVTVTVTVTVEKRKKKIMSTERAPDITVEADGRAESTTVLVDEGSFLSGYPTPADSDSDSRADSVSRMTRVSPGMGPHWTLSIRRVRVRRRPFALFISVQVLRVRVRQLRVTSELDLNPAGLRPLTPRLTTVPGTRLSVRPGP
jgi:hypothetical protein